MSKTTSVPVDPPLSTTKGVYAYIGSPSGKTSVFSYLKTLVRQIHDTISAALKDTANNGVWIDWYQKGNGYTNTDIVKGSVPNSLTVSGVGMIHYVNYKISDTYLYNKISDFDITVGTGTTAKTYDFVNHYLNNYEASVRNHHKQNYPDSTYSSYVQIGITMQNDSLQLPWDQYANCNYYYKNSTQNVTIPGNPF